MFPLYANCTLHSTNSIHIANRSHLVSQISMHFSTYETISARVICLSICTCTCNIIYILYVYSTFFVCMNTRAVARMCSKATKVNMVVVRQCPIPFNIPGKDNACTAPDINNRVWMSCLCTNRRL